MAITDLTGYTWFPNEYLNPMVEPYTTEFGYSMFWRRADCSEGFWGIEIHQTNDGAPVFVGKTYCIGVYNGVTIASYDATVQKYHTVQEFLTNGVYLIRGNDATNPNFIAWLEANGTLIAPYSKVVFGGKVLIDLTADTVDATHLAEGYTAHNAKGEEIVGTMQGGGAQVVTGTFVSGDDIWEEEYVEVYYIGTDDQLHHVHIEALEDPVTITVKGNTLGWSSDICDSAVVTGGSFQMLAQNQFEAGNAGFAYNLQDGFTITTSFGSASLMAGARDYQEQLERFGVNFNDEAET